MYRFLDKLQEQNYLSQRLSLITPSPHSMSNGSLINARRRWQSLSQVKRALLACLVLHQKGEAGRMEGRVETVWQ